MPRRGRRGYPTAILIGLNNQTANIWLVYSESIKQGMSIPKAVNDKTGSKHYENIVENIRTLLPDGFSQIIIASTEKYTRKSGLIEYINRSHLWLTKRFTIKELDKKAVMREDVLQLIKMNLIQDSISETAIETNEKIMENLEKALNKGDVLFTIQELSDALNREERPEFILVSEKYDVAWRDDRKYQRLIQIAKNMMANFTIVKHDTLAYSRLEQFGGFVCVIKR